MIFEKIRERLQKAREEAKELQKTTTDAYGYMKMKQGLDCAIGIVDEVETEYNNGWIKCEDELPKETQKYYLTYYKRDGGLLGTQNLAFVSKDYFMSDKRWEVEDEYPDAKVYYWQPLPQPPKGE